MSNTAIVIKTLNETGLSRVYQKTKEHAMGIITAHRGWVLVGDTQVNLTKAGNKARNKQLLSALLSLNYQVTSVKGSYIENYRTDGAKEVAESSFLVVNPTDGDDKGKLEKDLIKLGMHFDQDSILSVRFGVSAKLIGTTKRRGTEPEFLKSFDVGRFKGGVGNQFFSRIGGRQFAFESTETFPSPATRNGRWGLAIAAKPVLEAISQIDL